MDKHDHRQGTVGLIDLVIGVPPNKRAAIETRTVHPWVGGLLMAEHNVMLWLNICISGHK
jgi:hypothetical protein